MYCARIYSCAALLLVAALQSGAQPVKPQQATPEEFAKAARDIVHALDWVSVASISVDANIATYPFSNIQSMADGPLDSSSGIPYFYLTPYSTTARDVEKDDRVSVMGSMAQTGFCKEKNYDPIDHRCPRVILTGRLVKVDEGSEEYTFAKNALFSRHPDMPSWPKDHKWYVAKLNIEHIKVFSGFRIMGTVALNNYFESKV